MDYEYVSYIGVPLKRVWKALITKEDVDQYYLAPLGNLELEEDGEIYYGTESNKVISGEIIDFIEYEELSHSFKFAFRKDEEESVVLYQLEAIGDEVTELAVVHTGIVSEDTLQDIRGGWPTIISQLKTYLETGSGLSWPEIQDEAD